MEYKACFAAQFNGIVRRERRLIQSFLKNRLNAGALNILFTRQF
jgi:hypothetical protein